MTAPGPDGETGRRRGLKIPQPQGYAGSSPAPGTRKNNGLAFFRVSPTAVFRRASLRVAGLLSVSGQAQSALPVSLRERRRPACPIPGNELGPAAGRGVVVAGAGHGGRIGVGRTSLRQKASDFLVGTRPRVVGPPVPGGRSGGPLADWPEGSRIEVELAARMAAERKRPSSALRVMEESMEKKRPPRWRPLNSDPYCSIWRRGWDSNPRYSKLYTGFRIRLIRPL
jgi:hypothetical protein